jgi:hypothetical protein
VIIPNPGDGAVPSLRGRVGPPISRKRRLSVWCEVLMAPERLRRGCGDYGSRAADERRDIASTAD